MKKLLTFCLLLISFCFSSQEKKIRKLFPNEIQPLQKIEKKQTYSYINNTHTEVFIRIPETNKYKISIGDYSIENNIGIFYFVGLNLGQQSLNIYENNELIYKTYINIRNNHRLVFDFIYNEGLFLLEESPIKEHISTLNKNYFYGKRIMNEQEFGRFLEHFKKQAFIKDKYQTFKIKSNSTAFSAQQILLLINEISFDKDKLPLAKNAFKHCIDPENYYLIVEALDFISSKDELNNFINQHYQ